MSRSDGVPIGVVGLGAIGAATTYWLARRGAAVVGFEQFALGHADGASHDHSRIIRRSYHTPAYVALTAQAYAAWADVEGESGEQVVTITGGLDLFPPGAAIDAVTYRASLDTVGVPYEWISGAEVCSRWPGFRCGTLVADDVMAISSAATGIVAAQRAVSLFHRRARSLGAELRPATRVLEVRPVGDEVDVVTVAGTTQETTRCRAVVLCTDAWTNELLAPLGHHLPLVVTKEQVTYFPVADLRPFQPGRFPVWIWMDDPSFYGFPVFGDLTALKAAEDCGGVEVQARTRTFEPDAAMQARVAAFMGRLTGVDLGRPRTTTCLYTLTADRDFVVDRLPGFPQISLGLGAAHGFKFAAWFGSTLADLALGAEAPPTLTAFAFDRPALGRHFDRAAWLV